ncbi:SRPBCC family protein [Pseudarthrobacter sp. J1738]|uniref:SRPBCC family protein n=1 Tax=unclassified Pseudarthrobacter TaxID=2647000 RepID=UPI003D2E77C5
MSTAEYEVSIHKDAVTVYNFLADGLKNIEWREGVRSVALRSGAKGAKGAIYQQTLAGPGGRPIAGDYEITVARPGAELQFQVVAGPARPHGGFYLSSDGDSTRVRFVLDYVPKGLMKIMGSMVQKSMLTEVAQLERLKEVLEAAD